METASAFFKAAYECALDIFFPASAESAASARLSPEEFLKNTRMQETAYAATAKSADLISKNMQPALASITSLFHYRDEIVRKTIWELKYRGNKKVCRLFAALLYNVLVEHLSEEYLFSGISKPLLIPIPSAKDRKDERGYSHIELIVQELKKLDRNNFFTVRNDILIKNRSTLPQAKLHRHERLANLAGCFDIAPKIPHEKEKGPADSSMIMGKDIILIDDVATTGSTLEEAAEVLKHAGARSVAAFTIAH